MSAEPRRRSLLLEGALAGLAFGLADWLASGVGRSPLSMVALILASALMAGWIAGLATRFLGGRSGLALGLVLFGAGVLDAAAFASRELAERSTQLGFMAFVLVSTFVAAILAARAWRDRPGLGVAFWILAGIPAADLARRGVDGGTWVAFAACLLPPAASFLARQTSRRTISLLAALVALLFIYLDPPRETTTSFQTEGSTSAAASAPDVLLIVVDTLRADAVDAGGDPQRSAFARLAGDGVRFTQAIASAPWTLPSMSSLMTSLHPTQHGAMTVTRPLPSDIPTLAERFAAAGYATAAFTGGAFVSPTYGLHRGFQTFDADAEYRFRPSTHHTPLVSRIVRNRWFPQRWIVDRVHEFGGVAEVRKRAEQWLASRDSSRPVFLFVHTYEAHDYYLYDPPVDGPLRDDSSSPFGKRLSVHPEELFGLEQGQLDWFRQIYDARIAHVDAELCELLNAFEQASQRPRIVALTSDHGEGFDAGLGRVHHGGRLHDDLLRVPLFLVAPGLEGNKTVEHQVRTLDLGPSLLALARLEVPTDIAGRSFVAALAGVLAEGEGWPSPAWSEERGDMRSLRTDTWKVLGIDEEHRGFALSEDPLETNDRKDDLPPSLMRAWELFSERYPPRLADDSEIDEETHARLRALGYVD